MKTLDSNLLSKYDNVYSDGEEKFWTFLPIEERIAILQNVDFNGKNVLEIGCGTGDFAAWMATSGAKFVYAIDPSVEAVSQAIMKYDLPNLSFGDKEIGFDSIGTFDIVVMVGVLEHTIDPHAALDIINSKYMESGSILATSSPHFANPRGFIWLALKELFDAPMSLTDRHEIKPEELIEYCEGIGLECLDMVNVDKSWGCGTKFIQDFKERLPKVFPDMDQGKINRFLSKIVIHDHAYYHGDGANAVYFFKKA